MHQKKVRNIGIILIIVGLLTILIANLFNYFVYPEKNEVCFKENCFEVELATTPKEQAIGLSNRSSLDPNKGMLFIFGKEGDYPFWMKGMLFPLDMIWISSNSTVVDIGRSMDTCIICFGIYPEANATYVLELNANTTQRINLNVGDKLDLRIPRRYLS